MCCLPFAQRFSVGRFGIFWWRFRSFGELGRKEKVGKGKGAERENRLTYSTSPRYIKNGPFRSEERTLHKMMDPAPVKTMFLG
jgi:hypothetical protein